MGYTHIVTVIESRVDRCVKERREVPYSEAAIAGARRRWCTSFDVFKHSSFIGFWNKRCPMAIIPSPLLFVGTRMSEAKFGSQYLARSSLDHRSAPIEIVRGSGSGFRRVDKNVTSYACCSAANRLVAPSTSS